MKCCLHIIFIIFFYFVQFSIAASVLIFIAMVTFGVFWQKTKPVFVALQGNNSDGMPPKLIASIVIPMNVDADAY